jgi:hypothetical protein
LNFGFFATPERREIFHINDVDETLPAPWEWDVKRLAASFVLACRRQRLQRTVCTGLRCPAFDLIENIWRNSVKWQFWIKLLVELFSPSVMTQYAESRGWTLAMAHARSGEPSKISGYLGKSDKFDKAVADFSVAYSDQSERNHKIFAKAVREGRLEIETY